MNPVKLHKCKIQSNEHCRNRAAYRTIARAHSVKTLNMSKPLQKPTILNVETVARSRLFNVESVDLEFSNGVRRVYERMRPSTREAVMIVPIVDDHLILIREYAVGTESYELGFSKGLIDPGESVFEAANRELKEEVGFGANDLTFLKS